MDSTMLYQLVLEQLHTGQQLVNLLPSLANLLNPQANMTTDQMNQQQIFSQVYKSITHALKKQPAEKKELLTLVDDNIKEQSQGISDSEEQSPLEEEQNDWDAGQQEIEGQQGEEEEQAANYGQIEEEQQEDENQDDRMDDEQAFEGEEDVGLYGEQIDEQQMESYQNQGDSQQQRQFEEQQKQIASKKGRRKSHQPKEDEQQDEGQDLINDQFNQFREIQLQNKQEEAVASEQKTELQKQIQKLQSKIINKKDWVLRGQVKASQRPANSLLEYDLQFKTGIKLNQEVTPAYNEELQNMIKQRILDELYDDRVRYQHSHVLREQYSSLKEVSRQKSKMGLGELYEAEFKNYLGLGDNKNDKLKQQILQAFKEVNYYLDSLSNSNFTPRPSTGSKNEVVISEEKVPINHWKGNNDTLVNGIDNRKISQKQQNKKGKRTKNKRIERQRKKQQMRKKLNKKIEFGGMTKHEAKAALLKNKNNLNKDNVKYNKSSNFFAEMNKEKKGKPNPNIGKLKI